MELEQLKHELKQLIIDECDKDELDADDISDDEILFGEATQVNLDSLDALQISVAIKKQYGVRIEGSGESRDAFKNIQSLALFIQNNQ